MHTDADFLKMLLADPADDTTRLVYGDWLEEQGDYVSAAKAEFLRLTARLATPAGTNRERKRAEKRLQELAKGLSTDWLAVVSRLPIEYCHQKRTEAEERAHAMGVQFDYLCERQHAMGVQFYYLCERRWENLQPTADRALRFCDACRQNVHYCDTITEARMRAQNGHCIAVDLGVIRRERDLGPLVQVMGRPSRQAVWPDPVSAERERRKREKSGDGLRQLIGLPARPDDRGDRVRVKDGTFAGMEGEVKEILEARSLVRVELTIFGRPVPVELEYWQVEPV
jgi:uncharacterized protein (TIGR02996 family)